MRGRSLNLAPLDQLQVVKGHLDALALGVVGRGLHLAQQVGGRKISGQVLVLELRVVQALRRKERGLVGQRWLGLVVAAVVPRAVAGQLEVQTAQVGGNGLMLALAVVCRDAFDYSATVLHSSHAYVVAGEAFDCV